jgi:hypothetical protein
MASTLNHKALSGREAVSKLYSISSQHHKAIKRPNYALKVEAEPREYFTFFMQTGFDPLIETAVHLGREMKARLGARAVMQVAAKERQFVIDIYSCMVL